MGEYHNGFGLGAGPHCRKNFDTLLKPPTSNSTKLQSLQKGSPTRRCEPQEPAGQSFGCPRVPAARWRRRSQIFARAEHPWEPGEPLGAGAARGRARGARRSARRGRWRPRARLRRPEGRVARPSALGPHPAASCFRPGWRFQAARATRDSHAYVRKRKPSTKTSLRPWRRVPVGRRGVGGTSIHVPTARASLDASWEVVRG